MSNSRPSKWIASARAFVPGIIMLLIAAGQALAGTKLTVEMRQDRALAVSVDPAVHRTFGLAYPVTYRIEIPQGSANLQAWIGHSALPDWRALPEKFSTDFFNGEEVVRFDYAAGIAYVSAAFDSTSDQLFIRITDEAGQPLEIAYQGICRYYDNREAVVTASADDWNDFANDAFEYAANLFRSFHIPLTTAIVTKQVERATWARIQAQVNAGLIEPASHNRTHQVPPVSEPVYELRGSKEDILHNLNLPPLYRNGPLQYVYTWIAPSGVTDATDERVVTESQYLAERLVYPTSGAFAAWDASQERYPQDGMTTEMGPLYGGITDLNQLNAKFDDHLSRGTIYHVMIHPQVLTDYGEWSKSYIPEHLGYIGNRTNVWYVNFGHLYLYHLLADDQAETINITERPALVIDSPTNQTVADGQAATFSVMAAGTPPLFYEWRKNGVPIPGATGSTYPIPAASLSDDGSLYRCVVTNSSGSSNSAEGLLKVSATGTSEINILTNGTFEGGTSGWVFFTNGSGNFDVASPGYNGNGQAAHVSIASPGTNVQLHQFGITLEPNTDYVMSFNAYSNTGHNLQVSLGKHASPYTDYGITSRPFNLSASWQSFSVTFTTKNFSSPVSDARLMFWLAADNAAGDEYYIDNVMLAKVSDLPPPAPIIVEQAPVITLDPQNVTVPEGQAASFTVTATGTEPLAYQWQKNSISIAGATGNSYTTPTTIHADSGALYRCVVTNQAGSITSRAAMLTVTTPPPVILNALSNGAFEGGTTYWDFYSNGSASASTVTRGSGQALQLAVTTEGTNVQLYQYDITLEPNTAYQLSFDAYSSTGHDVDVSLQRHASPYTNYGLAGHTFNLTTEWQTYTATFTTANFSETVSDARLMFWLAPYDAAGDRYYFDNIVLAKVSDLTPVAPTITTQPSNQTVNAGSTAAFSVTATSTAPLTYQWQRNGAAISGATSSSYTTPATTRADSGAAFRCVVSNAGGSTTSASALLLVVTPQPAVILADPRDTTVQEGKAASFAVTAAGTAPMTYQWQKNGSVISGATSASYTTGATVVSADSGARYRCIVANSAGKDTSLAALLRVMPVPPAITVQPGNQTVTSGSTATFSVTASGTAPLSYQWQKDSIAINGATSASYTTPAVSRADSGASFRCVVTNSGGSAISASALLLVSTPYPPVVTAEPRDTTVQEGHAAAFGITATGTLPLSYQWQKNGTSIGGATSASYPVSAAAFADSGSAFRCIVSNAAGKDTSIAAILHVLPTPPAITAQPGNQSVISGQAATFAVTATGTAPLAYQWQKDSIAIAGANGASYTTPAVSRADSGTSFRCFVTNRAGSVTSTTALLLVTTQQSPVVTADPRDTTVQEGRTAWFSIAATGTAPLSYQWQKNGANITGATSASYTTPATFRSDSGAVFRCIVSNSAGKDTSLGALLRVMGIAPSITAQPSSQTVTVGQAATFSITATGSTPLYYQWQKNGTPIAGATSASYTTGATLSSDSGATFRCVATNAAGSATSDAAILIVNRPPPVIANALTNGAFESGSANWSFYSNGSAAFSTISSSGGQAAQVSITTEGSNVQLYQYNISLSPNTAYQLSFDAYSSTGHDVDISLQQHTSPYTNYGLTAHTFNLSTSWQSFTIQFTTANFSGSVSDARLMLWIAPYDAAGDKYYFDNVVLAKVSDLTPVAPTITLQPANQVTNAGATATFTVAATGTAPLSYQWQKNATPIGGATSTSYTTPATTRADSGASFRCVVTNAGGSAISANALLSVITPEPPLVTADPRDTTVQEGQTAKFQVTVSGTAPLSYQWQKSGVSISGATSESYVTPLTVPTDSGSVFRCIVSNTAGKDTSLGAVLRVLRIPPTPPVITVQPAAQSVQLGQTATFSVNATGTAPLSYQWQKNNSPISGATGASYTTPATVASDSGTSFRCVVTNSAGSATSQMAMLMVTTPPPVVANALTNGSFESGTSGWNFYTNGAGSTSTVSSGTGQAMQIAITTEGSNVQLFQYGITLSPNTSYQLTFDAYSSTGHDVQVSLQQHASPYENYGLSARAFDLSTGWQTYAVTFTTINFSSIVSDARLMFWIAPYDAAGDRYYFDNIVLAKVSDLASPVVSVQPANQTVMLGDMATFTVGAVGSLPLAYQWQRNGSVISGATGITYTTPATVRADSGAAFRCVITNAAGSVTSATAMLSVITPQAPVVTADPRDTTVMEGQTASFSVTATGTAPLSYQWQKNGAAIGGATGSSYVTPVTTPADSGARFLCIVTNVAGKDTSSAALLRVNRLLVPFVTLDPRDTTVIEGQTARFQVSASGTAPLSYQWQKNGATISGATSATYQTPPEVPADSASLFRCIISNMAGKDTSAAAMLRVIRLQAPLVILNPRDTAVFKGQAATFSILASGTAPLSYQWLKNGSPVSGATAISYTTPGTAAADSGSTYRCVVTNIAGRDTSRSAILTVITPSIPVVTLNPRDTTIFEGQTAHFSVAAGGTAPLAYQWQKNAVSIPGATSSSYTTPPASNADSNTVFRCIVANNFGADTSANATLLVLPLHRPVITLNPHDTTVYRGETATFTIHASGTSPLIYQWQKNGVPIIGATNPSYTTPPAEPSDSGSSFRCMVSNIAGLDSSAFAHLTVITPRIAVITLDPRDTTVMEGQAVHFAVAATGTSPLAYQWQRNDSTIAGANAGTYSLPAAARTDSGALFRCIVTNIAGADTSAAAMLHVIPLLRPAITQQPANQSVWVGRTATFAISATGTAPLSFQWLRNGIPIAEATGNSYISPAVTLADSGSIFRCAVSNAAGSDTSHGAILEVTPIPGPSVAIWYGPNQTFGRIGVPQRWVNILGNASDSTGVTSLSYTLNGSTPVALSMGPDDRRLARTGDFNADIAYDSLRPGSNTVVVTAHNGLGGTSIRTVTVTRANPAVWPIPYNVTFSSDSSLTDSVQVVDGRWGTVPGGARILERSYDRLIAIGDTTWTDYEVTARITIDGFDSSSAVFGYPSGGPAIGLLMRWNGHTTNPLGESQPLEGYLPLGAIGWIHWLRPDSSQWELMGNNLAMRNLQPSAALPLSFGVPYVFKMRVKTEAGVGGLYSFKAWNAADPEPATWLLSGEEALSSNPQHGSLLLVAQHVSATIHHVSVAAVPKDTLSPMAKKNALLALIPKEFSLEGNYPNPFNPTTTIRYGLPEPSTVSIVIYNVLGQEVELLTDGPQDAGMYNLTWTGRASSGMYFYRMVANGQSGKSYVATKRMLLVK